MKISQGDEVVKHKNTVCKVCELNVHGVDEVFPSSLNVLCSLTISGRILHIF